jgi:DNA gyrase subunit B
MENQFKNTNMGGISLTESIRLRPAMYIGSTEGKGICTMIEHFILDLMSSAKMEEVDVELAPDGAVRITSSAIDVDSLIKKLGLLKKGSNPEEHKNILDLAVIIGLSRSVKMEIYNGGKIHTLLSRERQPDISIEEGYLREDLIIDFIPDGEIFKTTDLDFEYLCSVFRKTAYLNPTIKISFSDNLHNDFQQCVFHSPKGIFHRMDQLVMERSLNEPSFRLDIEKEHNGYQYKISIALLDYTTDSYIQSFAGDTETYNHGSLVDGVKKGMLRFIKDFTGQDVDIDNSGLILITSVSGTQFTYSGSLKIELEQPEIENTTEDIVYKELTDYMESDKEKVSKFAERFKDKAN